MYYDTVSTHSRPKAAAPRFHQNLCLDMVSTHSRPKAAALIRILLSVFCKRFNTQPPEGGCVMRRLICKRCGRFNTQPPEGGCAKGVGENSGCLVSTHSRPKAAACEKCLRWRWIISFNTQPPEGGCSPDVMAESWLYCFNTQPPEGGCAACSLVRSLGALFQHTAARRRLLPLAKRLPIQALKPVIRQRCRKRQWGQV